VSEILRMLLFCDKTTLTPSPVTLILSIKLPSPQNSMTHNTYNHARSLHTEPGMSMCQWRATEAC